jgi:uncharacterized protein YjiS (DUF1127 family)
METAMTFYSDTQTPSQFARLVHAVSGVVVERTRAFFQIAKNRRDAALLTGLDDRMLADIGLTRGDIRDAYSEPVWRDPTTILVSRVSERRVNRRRTPTGLESTTVYAPSIVPALPKHVSVNVCG